MKSSELESILQKTTVEVLELPDKQVRKSWPTYNAAGTALGWRWEETVAFLRVTPGLDPYCDFVEHVDDNWEQTESWQATWIIYGSEGTDWAQQIRDSLRQFGSANLSMKDALAQQHIFPLPRISAPSRVPELWAEKWWERADLTVQFYVGVKKTKEQQDFAIGPDISIYTERGEADGIIPG